MRKNNSFAWICLVSAGIFFSCIITPQARETSPNSGVPNSGAPGIGVSTPASPATPSPKTISQVTPPETIPLGTLPEETAQVVAVAGLSASAGPNRSVEVLPAISLGRVSVPLSIMGKGIVPQKEMAAFLVESNPGVERAFIQELAYIYTEESAVEGVNSDVAFAQMCLETGFLRFGGLVTADMNNFCGLGATGPTERGLIFPNPRMGVRAHIQHLKAYATEEPLRQVLVDPRFHYVSRGSSPAIDGLTGTWATDRFYAEKITNILERLYTFYYKY